MRRYFGASLAEPGPGWEASLEPVPPQPGGPCEWPENGGPFSWWTHSDAYELGLECICPSRFNGDCNEPVDPFFFTDDYNAGLEMMAPEGTSTAFEAAGINVGEEEEKALTRQGKWTPPKGPKAWTWKDWALIGGIAAIGLGVSGYIITR